MGASARIMAYLGLDNSPFTRTLDQTVVAGEQAMKGLERSFGAHHIFKGLLQGMGIGSIEGISAAIQSPFKHGAEEAERAARASEAMGDTTFKALAGFGNLQQKLMATRAQIKGMPVELAFAQKALKDLDSGFTGVIKWVSPETMAAVRAAEANVDSITAKTGELHLEEKRITEEIAQQNREFDRQAEKINRSVLMSGQPIDAQISLHRARAADLKFQAEDRNITDDERKNLRLEAQQELADATIKEKQLALFKLDSADRLMEIDRRGAMLNATSAEKITSLRKEAARFAELGEDASRTEAQQQEDKVKARDLWDQASREELSRTVELHAIEDEIRGIQEASAAVGETTGEKILQLKRDALFYDQRSHDLDRTEKERETDHVRAAQLAASAAEAEYNWKNKSLTVDEAAKTLSGRNSTTTLGVQARRIQSYTRQAEEARRSGRYGMASRYDDLVRNETEEFQKKDWAGRAGAAAGPAQSAWDRKYGSEMAAREARFSVANRSPSGASMESAAPELKSAAVALKVAAADLKGALRPVTFGGVKSGPTSR